MTTSTIIVLVIVKIKTISRRKIKSGGYNNEKCKGISNKWKTGC